LQRITDVGLSADDGGRQDYDLAVRVKRGLDKLGLHLGLSIRQGILLQEDEDRKREARVLALDVPRPRDSWKMVPGARLREWAGETRNDSVLRV